MSPQESLNLESLGERYEIIGELAGRGDARTFMARKRDTGAPVSIVVATTPAGDEGNALSHLAADVTLLQPQPRRGVLPIVDSEWLGTDAFAVVTERTSAPTLDELLSRRGEDFTYMRIASVLQQVNAVIEWARDQKVIHRIVTPETLHVEPGSDHVLVSFAVGALPLDGAPGAEADARTIAVLARAMLTRSPAAPERADKPLSELRPGLPASLVEETEALLALTSSSGSVTDPSTYIAHIAMADALKEGEEHIERARNIIDEQKRSHDEQLLKERTDHEALIASERKEHDERLAVERREHEKTVADQARRFQKEREDFERQLSKERKALEKEREALAKELAAHAADRALLLQEREKHDREVTEVRERLEWETAAIATQAELYAQTAEVPTPSAATPVVRPPWVQERERGTAARANRGVAGPAWWSILWDKRRHWRREWNRPAAAAAVVLLVGASAIGIGARRSKDADAGAGVSDSAAGRVISSAGTVTRSTPDSSAIDSLRTDTSAIEEPRPARRRSYFAPIASAARDTASRDSVTRDTVVRADTTPTVFRPLVGADSSAPRDTTTRPKADSLAKRDTVARTDTTARRDTTGARTRP